MKRLLKLRVLALAFKSYRSKWISVEFEYVSAGTILRLDPTKMQDTAVGDYENREGNVFPKLSREYGNETSFGGWSRHSHCSCARIHTWRRIFCCLYVEWEQYEPLCAPMFDISTSFLPFLRKARRRPYQNVSLHKFRRWPPAVSDTPARGNVAIVTTNASRLARVAIFRSANLELEK